MSLCVCEEVCMFHCVCMCEEGCLCQCVCVRRGVPYVPQATKVFS